ncbi:hypothetical protein W02_03420 [Nitrospira sp. KM1]|nr:hypothetical protein W02_03420 [Nitrospira sp. KM1]
MLSRVRGRKFDAGAEMSKTTIEFVGARGEYEHNPRFEYRHNHFETQSLPVLISPRHLAALQVLFSTEERYFYGYNPGHRR